MVGHAIISCHEPRCWLSDQICSVSTNMKQLKSAVTTPGVGVKQVTEATGQKACCEEEAESLRRQALTDPSTKASLVRDCDVVASSNGIHSNMLALTFARSGPFLLTSQVP